MQTEDQRASYRCMVTDGRHQCEYQIGDQQLPARLWDESAGGFAILLDHLAGTVVGAEAHLHTDTGWYSVRVAGILEVKPLEDDDIFANKEGPWYRLGLVRLGETATPKEPETSPWRSFLSARLIHRNDRNNLLLIGLALTAMIILFPWIWNGGGWKTNPGQTKSKPQAAPPKKIAEPRNTTSSESLTTNNAITSISDKTQAFSKESAFNQSSPSDSDNSFSPPPPMPEIMRTKLRDLSDKFPGPSFFALPDVVRQLALTQDQQLQISQIVEWTSAAVHDLDKALQGQQRYLISEERLRLLDAGRQEVMKLLSDDQKSAWENITNENEK